MDLQMDISSYQERIGENIKRIMATKNITQERLIQKCKSQNFHISQGTISAAKNGKGNLTLSNLIALAYALDVNVVELLDKPFDVEKEFFAEKKQQVYSEFQSDLLIHNPESIYLKGYMGDFHTLFFKTSGRNDELVRGTLHIGKNGSGSRCTATLRLYTGNKEPGSGNVTEKVYEGELAVSHTMRASYVYLYNSRDQELCMMIFQYIYTRDEPIETAMAVAVTAASGANRRPTVHRMCLSRAYVDGETLEYVKGQLLMNTATIYLTDEKLNQLCSSGNIPDTFKNILLRVKSKKQCYCITEESLYDGSLLEEERHKLISLVRAHSEAPKYNKISRGTDEVLYSILGSSKQ